VATRFKYHQRPSIAVKIESVWLLGLCPTPHCGSLQCCPRPIAGGEGTSYPSPKKPFPISAFSLNLRPCGPQTLAFRASSASCPLKSESCYTTASRHNVISTGELFRWPSAEGSDSLMVSWAPVTVLHRHLCNLKATMENVFY